MKNMLPAVAVLCAVAVRASAASDAIPVGVGQVSVVRSRQAIATLVVGDPAVADVVAEGENAVLIFGKKLGRTDLVLMGKDHHLLRQSSVVVGPTATGDTVLVRHPSADGMADDAWVCAPSCMRIKDK